MARRGWADDRAGHHELGRPINTYAPVAAAAHQVARGAPIPRAHRVSSGFTLGEPTLASRSSAIGGVRLGPPGSTGSIWRTPRWRVSRWWSLAGRAGAPAGRTLHPHRRKSVILPARAVGAPPRRTSAPRGPMFELQHQTVNGHDLAYRMEGQGQAVLLIHGIASSSATWCEAVRRLVPRFRVVAPDLLGHGESEKPVGDYSLGAQASFLRDLLRKLGIRRATVVGHSFGGGIAMQLSYQHPEVCERVVLVSSGGLGREVNAVLRLLSVPGAEWALPIVVPSFVRDGGNAVLAWIRGRGIQSPRIHEWWQAYASLAEPGTRHAFVRELRSVVEFSGQIVSAKDRLHASAEHPTLIVWGDRDAMIPLDHGRAAHALIAGSRLEIFEGAGHFPHAEYPDRFAEVLGEFIGSTKPAPDSHPGTGLPRDGPPRRRRSGRSATAHRGGQRRRRRGDATARPAH
jgi:pimeloyl-ACP methyl ester carboxylesterase